MRILFLSSWYPTTSNPNFGIFVKEHAHAIKTAGNEIIVLALVITKDKKIWTKTVTDDYDINGIRTITIEIDTRFKDLLYHFVHVQYCLVKKTFNQKVRPGFTPDIVHSNVIFPAGIIGNRLSRHIKKPHVITEHWSRLRDFMDKPVLSNMALNAYNRATRILPVSGFLKGKMIEILPTVETSKYCVIGNVIDSEIFFFKEKTTISDKIRFCAVATWANKKVPDKMPELFIEALAKLQTNLKQTIILTMIGGGDKVDELTKLCIQKGLESEFLGYQTKTEIAQQLQLSDFFVHASTIETFGVVTAEALMCGTPVICSNVGALPELIDESNGILCENSVDSWIVGLRKAISTSFNNKEISGKIKQKYSLLEIGKQFSSVYSEI